MRSTSILTEKLMGGTTMYYCGIDWAVEKLDFCVIDENEQQALAFSVLNNYNGYIEALGLIQKLEDFGEIQFAMMHG